MWNLVRTHIPGKQEQWFLIKHQDAVARPEGEYSIVQAQPDSVLGERTLVPQKRDSSAAPKSKKADAPQGRKGDLPLTSAPQLATLVDAAPGGDDWRCEIKFDGYRMLARTSRLTHGTPPRQTWKSPTGLCSTLTLIRRCHGGVWGRPRS